MPSKSNLKTTSDGAQGHITIPPLSIEPTDPVLNAVYLDDGTNTSSTVVGFRQWNGSTWDDVGSATTGKLDLTAGAGSPPTTNGAASGSIETATYAVLIPTQDFDASTDEYIQWVFSMPDNWDALTVAAIFKWSAASGSGDVVWGLQGVSLSNDDALDTDFGTAQIVTDTLTATGDLCVTAATSAITLANTPSAGDFVVFRAYRDANNGSDTLAVDAQLISVEITYGIA